MKAAFTSIPFDEKRPLSNFPPADLDTNSSILDIFQKHGCNEIDISCRYRNETPLCDLQCQERGLRISLKSVFPGLSNTGDTSPKGWHFDQKDHTSMLRSQLCKSLTQLQLPKLHVYFPILDCSVPLAEALASINDIHQEGLFTHFGISNLPAWEVAQLYELCNRHGWVRPSVYKENYNVLHRSVEAELFPCLKHYGISFYASNPMAGGFPSGDALRERIENGFYGQKEHFAAMEILFPVMERYGLSLRQCALRWMANHSLLRKEKGDAMLVGGMNAKHLENNLADMGKGPLPEEVLGALEKAWEEVRGVSQRYWM